VILLSFVDSHTGGEPTRLVTNGLPDFGGGTVAEQAAVFARDFDHYRRAIVNEPRGNDVLVGAIIVAPSAPDANLGVIFFNNVGLLGMCGHGTIGVVASLPDLPDTVVIETPVGIVSASRNADKSVAITNVRSYLISESIQLDVPVIGTVSGAVAYGGNTFLLITDHPWSKGIHMCDVRDMTLYCEAVLTAARQVEPAVDHIELFAAPVEPANDSRNFVLCPGGQYDRSPCGTGTSAKLAWLHALGKLKDGEIYRQESVTGSVFKGQVVSHPDGGVTPTITGTAFVTARGELSIDPTDDLGWGIVSE
jgi:4-hydroxyproline epimerase